MRERHDHDAAFSKHGDERERELVQDEPMEARAARHNRKQSRREDDSANGILDDRRELVSKTTLPMLVPARLAF